MRTLLIVVTLLGACELVPPPKKQPPAAAKPADLPPPPPTDTGSGSAAPAPAPTPTPPPPAPADAGVAVAPVDALETSAACTEVGVKIASQVIDEAQDPAQKAALAQERDRIVRRTAEACTRDQWPDAARACFLKAKTTAEMQVCGKDLAAPREE